MAPNLVLGIALVLAPSPAIALTKNYESDGWSLRVRHDDFTGQIRCDLTSTDRRLRYQPGALGFLVRKGRGTLEAWYKIDSGGAVRWQDREATLIAWGVAIDGPALDDPTGGWVWIPEREIADAQTVEIRADSGTRVRRFALKGFALMLEAAHGLGCGAHDAFRV